MVYIPFVFISSDAPQAGQQPCLLRVTGGMPAADASSSAGATHNQQHQIAFKEYSAARNPQKIPEQSASRVPQINLDIRISIIKLGFSIDTLMVFSMGKRKNAF